MIDGDTMRNLQKLARVKLEPDEERDLASQREHILDYFQLLMRYDAVDADLKVALSPEALRRDAAGAAFRRETLESLAVEFGNGHFIVPRILDGTDG